MIEGIRTLSGPYDKRYDPYVPGRDTPTPRAKPGGYRGWHQDLRIPGPVPAFPWGDEDLAAMKLAAIHDITRLRTEGAPLVMDRSWMSSDPHRWSVSQDRADVMIQEVVRWQPPEGVLAQHRVEARETVYTLMVRAGVVPRCARRRVRSRMRV